MRLTLVIPALLPSSDSREDEGRTPRAPALEKLLARGDVAHERALGCDAWLCRAFGIASAEDWPVAPLTAAADGIDASRGYWLRADPVELRIEHNRLTLARHADDLDAAEANALVAALNAHFAHDGLAFFAPRPERWYLRTEEPPGIATTPLARALYREVAPQLPRGAGALAWHRVMNEAQMVLHAHAVNAAREARGAGTANSVWLWGGGGMPLPARAPFDAVWSEEALARALAASAGIAHHALPRNAQAWLAATAERHLLVFGTAAQVPWNARLEDFERAWIAPLLDALRARRIDRMALVTNRGQDLFEATLARPHLLRIWRRLRPLPTRTA